MRKWRNVLFLAALARACGRRLSVAQRPVRHLRYARALAPMMIANLRDASELVEEAIAQEREHAFDFSDEPTDEPLELEEEPVMDEPLAEDTFEYVVEAELVLDEPVPEPSTTYEPASATGARARANAAEDGGGGERTFDASPIADEDLDGLVAVGSAALSDAVDEVGEIADALAQKLIQFQFSDGAKEASAHLDAAAGGLAELFAIAKRVSGGAARAPSSSDVSEMSITLRPGPPASTDVASTIGSAASTVLFSSLRAVGVVVRDVVLSPEVSEHTLKAARGSVKAASAFGRAALQRLDGGVSERERISARARARIAEDEVLIMEPQWVEKKRGAFGNWEIVDSSRKRRRRQQANDVRAETGAENQTAR